MEIEDEVWKDYVATYLEVDQILAIIEIETSHDLVEALYNRIREYAEEINEAIEDDSDLPEDGIC